MNDLIASMERYRRQNPAQRIGQSYFNGLYEVRPDIADQVRGTKSDPFYDDARLPAFFKAIAKFV